MSLFPGCTGDFSGRLKFLCRGGNLYTVAITWLLLSWFSCQGSRIFSHLFEIMFYFCAAVSFGDVQEFSCYAFWWFCINAFRIFVVDVGLQRKRGKKTEKTWHTDSQPYDFFDVLWPNKRLSSTLFFLNLSAGSKFAELRERFRCSLGSSSAHS